MNKYILLISIMVVSLFSGCEKDDDPSSTESSPIIGLWEVNLYTYSILDDSANVVLTDTVTPVDSQGNPLTLLERYGANSSYYLFSNTEADTLQVGTYSIQNDHILINIPDSIYAFNNRLITRLDTDTVAYYQDYLDRTPKERWQQRSHKR